VLGIPNGPWLGGLRRWVVVLLTDSLVEVGEMSCLQVDFVSFSEAAFSINRFFLCLLGLLDTFELFLLAFWL